jgi:hypothetical protein
VPIWASSVSKAGHCCAVAVVRWAGVPLVGVSGLVVSTEPSAKE